MDELKNDAKEGWRPEAGSRSHRWRGWTKPTRREHLEMESAMTVPQIGNAALPALPVLMAIWTLGRRLLTPRASAAMSQRYGCSGHR